MLAGEKEGTNRDEEDLSGLLAWIAGSIGENGTWDGSSSIAKRISNMANVNWGFHWEGDECRLTRLYFDEWREVSFSPEMNIFYQVFISWLYTGQFCMSSVDGKIVTAPAFEKDEDYFSYMYLCKDGNWHYIGRNVRSYDEGWNTTQEWCDNFIEDFSSGKDGEIRKGDITGLDYKYDEKMGKWRRIDSRDALFSTVCTLNHVGELIENVIDTLTSIHKTYFDTVTYVCDENGWRKIAVAEENFGATCTDKNRGLCKQFGDSVFCCDSSGWRKANYGIDAFEEDVREICNRDKRGKIIKGLSGVSYKCIGGVTYDSSCVDIFGVDTCNYTPTEWQKLLPLDSLLWLCGGLERRYSCKSGNLQFQCRDSGIWLGFGCDVADSIKLYNLYKSGYINNYAINCYPNDLIDDCPIEI